MGRAALLYLVVAVLFVGPALLPGRTLSNADVLWFEPPWVGVKPAELERPSNPELGDWPRYLQPFLRETVAAMPEVPLWNPNIVAGHPFQANAQSSVFGPFTLVAYVLPFWTALGWMAVLKLWVAAFGTFLLARALGMRYAGALLAGLVFALNLKLVTWLSYPHMSVWSLIPWLLLATERLVRRPDLLSGAGLAAVVGLQFLCGHPESSFHALLAAVAFFALRLWQARRAEGNSLARPFAAFAAALVGGAALAAVTLIPFTELLLMSSDLPDRRGLSIDHHYPLKDALGVFLPDYWGRPTQTPLRPFLLERAVYVGALPLMLAAAALLLRPRVERVAIALFGAFWALVLFGLPPFLQIVTRIPPFSSGHNERLIVLTLLCTALLAGWGLADLRASAQSRTRLVLAAAVALFLVPLAVALAAGGLSLDALGDALRVAWLFDDAPALVTNPAHEAVIRMSSMAIWAVLAAGAVALFALRLGGRLGPTAFAVLALLLVCVDLFRAGMGYNPAIDRDRALVPATGAIRVLAGRGTARFVSSSEIPQNVIPMQFGLYEARGYDLPAIRRFDRLWRQEISPESPTLARGLVDIPLEVRDVTPRALRTLRLLGATHLLRGTTGRASNPPYEPIAPYPPLATPGLSEIYAGPDGRVYRVAGALPRAWVVAAQQPVDGQAAALAAVTRAGFDPRRSAVTERRLPGLPVGERPPGGLARIIGYEPERVELRARSAGEGLLVLSDVYFPGWKAEVDGQEAEVEPVDYALRGVRVGPGEHSVVLRYAPLSWTLGRIVSLLALLGLVAALALGLRARRRRVRAAAG